MTVTFKVTDEGGSDTENLCNLTHISTPPPRTCFITRSRDTSPLADWRASALPPQSLTLNWGGNLTPPVKLGCSASVTVGKVSFQQIVDGNSAALSRHRVLVAYEPGWEPKHEAKETWADALDREESRGHGENPGGRERGTMDNLAEQAAQKVVQAAQWCEDVEIYLDSREVSWVIVSKLKSLIHAV